MRPVLVPYSGAAALRSELEFAMSQPDFEQLERLLRQNAARLRDETTARCLQLSTLKVPEMTDEAAARAGTAHIHELVLVVAALYPSEITLRDQYEWASTGLLDRQQIGYEYLATLIRVYFEVARDVLGSSKVSQLNSLEAFMTKVLTDVFLGTGDN